MSAELRLFIRSVWSRWFIAISGSLGVPLTLVSFFVENSAAKIALVITAIACICFAAFFSWREEHHKWLTEKKKTDALTAKLSPIIDISINDNGVAEDTDNNDFHT